MKDINERELERIAGGLNSVQKGEEVEQHDITTNDDSPFSNDNGDYVELG